MKIDLTCPIEIRGYELTCDEEGGAHARIKLNNLAHHPIARFDAVACWSNSETGLSEAQSFRVDQLNAEARAEFTFSLSAFAVPNADTIDIHFNRVRFADGAADWIGGQAECVNIDELPSLPENEAEFLADTVGDDAVRFPESHEKHWVCVCGRANYQHQESCMRCERSKSDVLKLMEHEKLLPATTDASPAALDDIDEDDWRLQDALRRFRYQRDILMRRTVTMSLVIILLLGFSAVSGYRQRVEEARRGAIPPTLSVSANQP